MQTLTMNVATGDTSAVVAAAIAALPWLDCAAAAAASPSDTVALTPTGGGTVLTLAVGVSAGAASNITNQRANYIRPVFDGIITTLPILPTSRPSIVPTDGGPLAEGY